MLHEIISYWKKNKKTNYKPNLPYQFKQHNDQCNICRTKLSGRPKSSKSAKLANLEKVAEQFQMQCFDDKFVSTDMLDYVMIYKTITLLDGNLWTLHVFNKQISKENKVINHLPKFLNGTTAIEIFSFFNSARNCFGNCNFPELITQKLIKVQKIFSLI